MKIKKEGDKFVVESSSRKGVEYNVDLAAPFCSCPAYIYRYKRKGELCKHLKAVKEKYGEVKGNSKIIDYVKRKGEVDSIELIEKFSEDEVNLLLEKGELIENRGVISLLS